MLIYLFCKHHCGSYKYSLFHLLSNLQDVIWHDKNLGRAIALWKHWESNSKAINSCLDNYYETSGSYKYSLFHLLSNVQDVTWHDKTLWGPWHDKNLENTKPLLKQSLWKLGILEIKSFQLLFNEQDAFCYNSDLVNLTKRHLILPISSAISWERCILTIQPTRIQPKYDLWSLS